MRYPATAYIPHFEDICTSTAHDSATISRAFPASILVSIYHFYSSDERTIKIATLTHRNAGWDVYDFHISWDVKGTEYEGTGISEPTPGYVLRKYVGTFRAEAKEEEGKAGIAAKDVRIEMRRQMLYLVQGFVIKKAPNAPAEEEVEEAVVAKKGTRATRGAVKGKGKEGVQSGRVTKKTAAPKPQVKANSLEAAMADSPALRKITTSATPKPQTATGAPAQAITTDPLFLNINGVPKFRIGGATEEEKELNKDLQGVGRGWAGWVRVEFW